MTVLCVDDQLINRKLLAAVLEAEGHRVLQAEDGLEALRILRSKPVDAVISDILMPRMDGYRLCAEVRRDPKLSKLPFVVYTATYNSPADEKLCYDLGADAYLRKPAEVEDLLAALAVATGGAPGRRATALVPFEETEVMKQYNEQLVLKLEEKNKELLDSLERLDLRNRALSAAANAILITNSDGVIEWFNPAFSKMTGYSPEETIGKRAGQLQKSGLHNQEFFTKLWRTILSGQIWHGELQNRRKDGSVYSEEMTITPVVNEVGKITHFIAVKQDISDRLATQAALRLENERFRRFAETDIAGIVVSDSNGKISFANDYYLNLLGVTRKDFLSRDMNWKEFIPTEWTAETEKVLHELQQHGSAKPFEREYLRANGERVPVIVAHALLPGSEGQIAGVILDITRQKSAIDGLRESELRFRQLVESIREVFYLIDAKMTQMFYISPAYEEIWGRTRESVYADPTSWGEAIHPDDRERIFREIAPHGTLIPASVEYRIVRPDGQIRSIRARQFPITNDAGEIYRFAGIADDITERKNIEIQLRQSQKMEAIGQLSGGVAHDFNNLLTVIMGHIDVLSEIHDESESKESIAEIRRAAERAANLTRQLLLFARKQSMQMKNLDINQVVTGTITLLTRILGEDIQLDFRPSTVELIVCADAGMLDQILMNLAVNARDAMPRGGKLLIETTRTEFDETTAANIPRVRPGIFAVISVTDSGTGIPTSLLPRIFEPFFTTKDVDKGTGLGLATVFGIAQQHDGWVDVYSEVGRGAVFRVYIPLVKESLPYKPVHSPAAATKGGNETILLVEDEPSIRVLLAKYLTQLGYTVKTAADGHEAIQIFAENQKNTRLVLTDIIMPGQMTGIELAEILTAQKPGLPIVFSSGYSDKKVPANIVLSEGKNFLGKPYNLADVARIIRAQLDDAV